MLTGGLFVRIYEEYINDYMIEIAEKLTTIRELVEKKREIYGRIQQAMSFKAAAKEKMTFEQIIEYQQFADFYCNEIAALNRRIDELEAALKLTEIKREITQENTDYLKVYGNLKELDCKQNGVISGLESVVERGRRTLAVL